MGGEWRETTLGDVLTLQRGFDLPEPEREQGPYPVIASTGRVGAHGAAMVRGPGVVIGRSGSLGGGQFIRSDFWPLNTTLWVKDFKGNDVRFCYYLLKSLDLAAFNAGSGVPTLNRNHIHPMPVRAPTNVQEQRAISHILGTLDDKIELNRRMNETLEAMARALFKSWFVDFDPVRAKAEGRDPGLPKSLADLFPESLEDSELGEIPTGWTRADLGSWVDVLSGGTPSRTNPSLWGGGIAWISPKVMTAIHADEADEYVTQQALGNGTRLTQSGSVLVMVRGMGLHQHVRVSQARKEVAFNQDVKAMVPRSIQPSLLLFALLDAQADFLGRVESSGHGTGKLPTAVLLARPITMPDCDIQSGLTKAFDVMNNRIGIARGECRTLASLRDTLLPKLISGDLRVKDAERIVEIV